MVKMRKLIALFLVLLMIFSLSACGKTEESVEEVEQVAEETEIDAGDSDIQKAILEVSDSNLKAFLAEVPGISANMDTVYEYTQYSSLNDKAQYEVNRNYNIECTPSESNTVVHDDFSMVAHIEYKGDNEFPTSVNISYTFTDNTDHKAACSWAYDLMRAIINKTTGDTLEVMAFGDSKALTTEEDKYSVVCNKELIDNTSVNSNYIATYTVVCTDTENEYSYSDINTFKTNLNPDYGIFKIGVMSYDSSVSAAENKIEGYFDSATTEATTKIISDYYKETNDEIDEEAFLSMQLISTKTNVDGDQGDLTCRVKSKYNKITNEYTSEIFDIQFVSFEQSERKLAYYDIEDFLTGLFNKTFELEQYYDKDTFEIDIIETGLNDDYGLPAVAKFDVEHVENSEIYYICVEITSKSAEVTAED